MSLGSRFRFTGNVYKVFLDLNVFVHFSFLSSLLLLKLTKERELSMLCPWLHFLCQLKCRNRVTDVELGLAVEERQQISLANRVCWNWFGPENVFFKVLFQVRLIKRETQTCQ